MDMSHPKTSRQGWLSQQHWTRWFVIAGVLIVISLLLRHLFLADRPVQSWQVENAGATELSPDGTLLAVVGGPMELFNFVDPRKPDVVSYSETLTTMVEVRRVADGQRLYAFRAPGVVALAFSPDSQLLLAGGGNGGNWLWRMQDGELVRQWNDRKKMNGVAFSPDGEHIATVSDNSTTVWRVADGAALLTLQDETMVTSIAFSPDGQLLATAGGWDHSTLWRVRDGQRLRIFKSGQPHRITFSPDGQLLAISSGSLWYAGGEITATGEVALWRVVGDDEQPVRVLGLPTSFNQVSFSPDGNLLAVSGREPARPLDFSPTSYFRRKSSVIQLFRVQDGVYVRSLRIPAGDSGTPRFTPDGKYLLATDENVINFWRLR